MIRRRRKPFHDISRMSVTFFSHDFVTHFHLFPVPPFPGSMAWLSLTVQASGR